jgi:photosystem II stability/assembly factor-like uncharacterized protein
MKQLYGLLLIIMSATAFGQQATPADQRIQGLKKRKVLEENSLIQSVPLRNIGPSIMSGRVTDIAVNPDKPEEFYVAYASGGLWYTKNNGQSFTPVFDYEDVMTIGAIAVDWKKDVIYVGTGEVNSSRSSYAGNGVYRSDDHGNSWRWLGLPESHHIGSIELDPQNPDIAYVAVLGHLYSGNKERGVYSTHDGGKNWKLSLFVNEYTGAVEVTMDPTNSQVLYACMWERQRKAWNFSESGEGSGIYRSDNAGETWTLLSTPGSGFPTGAGLGRIGLAIGYQNSSILYAVVDNQFAEETAIKERDTSVIVLEDFKDITKEKFLALDNHKLDVFLKEQNIPEIYTAALLKAKVQSGEFRPTVINEYLALGDYVFDLPIKGCEVYRSEDKGATWVKVHETDLGSMYYTYGYYFGKIYVSPVNINKLVILGVPVALSNNGGKTWKEIGADNVHADHHILWINPMNDSHMILGNDGGVNITYDDGASWFKANNPPVGQFYSVTVDDAKPYNVYGGLQDNGVWYGPSTYRKSNGWMQEGRYPYTFIYGGDGMQVQVDTRDNTTIYTGYQFGFYARMSRNEDQNYLEIRPRQEMGELPLRFNWQTPILLSRHQQDVLYYGSNRFHRSLKNGDELTTLSGDLSAGAKAGDVPYGTLTTISESPLRFGLIYVGSDDGKVHISQDGGYTWKDISSGLPKDLWVSRVVASAHDMNRVYVTLNGYRNDDFRPYVFISTNQGVTWVPLATDLPYEPVNVLREDPVNEDLLYIGTDNGLYISLNRGVSCMAAQGSGSDVMPRVAVHDLAIQEREKDLVVATHGRSLFVMDIEELQQLNTDILTKDLFVFPEPAVPFNPYQGEKSTWNTLAEPNVDSVTIAVYSKKSQQQALFQCLDADGSVLTQMNIQLKKGLNFIAYDLRADETVVSQREGWGKADNGQWYLQPGAYKIQISADGIQSQVIDLELVNK